MAFVFRSQLGKEKPIKTEDFLHTNEKIEKEYLDFKYTKNYKENIINNRKQNPNKNLAFFSSSKKEPSYFYSEENPGPGTYNPKSLNTKQSLENINKDELDDSNNNEKNQLFISREKRFKNNDYITNLPGPGKYYKDSNLYQKKYLTPRKDSCISYKKRKYLVNSEKRKITIPSKENNFGYSIDNEGEIKLEEDPYKKNKFNGTYKSSVGPGYYYIENYYLKKNNNAHDWSKYKEENNNNEKNNEIINIYESKLAIQTDSNHLKDYYKISPPNKVSSLNTISYTTDGNKERKIKNIITKNKNIFPNIPINFKIEEENPSKLREKLFKPSYIKQSDVPGPGEYKLLDEFDIIANNKQNQNFGSNITRGLLFSKEKNIMKLGLDDNNINNSRISSNEEKINKKENRFKLFDNQTKYQKIQNLILLKIKGIKDEYVNNKNEIDSRRGPGAYNLNPQKKIFSNDIQNFGSLSKRFDVEENDIKKNINNANKFNTLTSSEDYKNKKEILHFKSQVPKNILKRDVDGISFESIKNNKNTIINEYRKIPPVGYYSPEKKLSIEHEAKILMKLNEKSPGFGEGEKRFYEKENNENANLGVGCYNIIPPYKKFTQRKVPFIFGIEKNGIGSMLDNNLVKNKLGPGAYKINDKNDWNKKSFNKLFS